MYEYCSFYIVTSTTPATPLTISATGPAMTALPESTRAMTVSATGHAMTALPESTPATTSAMTSETTSGKTSATHLSGISYGSDKLDSNSKYSK